MGPPAALVSWTQPAVSKVWARGAGGRHGRRGAWAAGRCHNGAGLAKAARCAKTALVRQEYRYRAAAPLTARKRRLVAVGGRTPGLGGGGRWAAAGARWRACGWAPSLHRIWGREPGQYRVVLHRQVYPCPTPAICRASRWAGDFLLGSPRPAWQSDKRGYNV